ncbi:hypothetical protein GPICK_03770 [Geobacter pickeringii]|uniref:Uncharacterized protein n=1 Tax=Geobacter pickeringii TaxID=345632 RepID=A0A0B5BEW1_9BACT|nr:hypothetical protein GPICK_03770 [Geobacter pickeringii]
MAAPRLHVCIYLQHPFDDCYCMNITGATIPRLLDYCVGDFGSCPIFRKRHRHEKEPAAE